MSQLDKKVRNTWDRLKIVGIIMISVGFVSFSNHERIGDVFQLVGCAIILGSCFMNWRKRKLKLKMDQSKTYSS